MAQGCGGLIMEIVDKTKETWKIGDIVIDNDERKGIIKKTKDDDFVIVRIDEKHVGDYFSGLAYEAGINMYCLQRKAPEFHKVNDNNDNEEWQPGDVLKNNNGTVGLIVQDYMQGYHLINVTDNSIFTDEYDTLTDLQTNIRNLWHKENASLVIE